MLCVNTRRVSLNHTIMDRKRIALSWIGKGQKTELKSAKGFAERIFEILLKQSECESKMTTKVKADGAVVCYI